MSFKIVFGAFFVRGYYFVPYGIMQVYTFCLFLWKTSFLYLCVFCVFCLFCVEFDVIFINFVYLYNLCLSTFLVSVTLRFYSHLLETICKNRCHVIKRELLNFKSSIYKEKCETFTKWKSKKRYYRNPEGAYLAAPYFFCRRFIIFSLLLFLCHFMFASLFKWQQKCKVVATK